MKDFVVLTEYIPSDPIQLSIAQRDTLRQIVRGLTITPIPGSEDTYTLTGGSTVGVARVGDLTVELRPKIGVAPLLFLISYALDARAWKPEDAALARDANLAEAVVPLFARTAQDALRPGLLHGYRHCDDTLTTVRGRVRIADQFGARTGMALPIEVAYDDFTPDILENQLLRTAVDVLGRLYLRHEPSRISLARLRQQLNGITGLAPDRRAVSEPHWTRLNDRYRPAVGLARLIISTAGLEARAGGENASVFLVDMNAVFEDFVRAALREALRLDVRAFPASASGHRLFLDAERRVSLEPDLTWWVGGRCIFVGDCKYKKADGSAPNADVYQMLAYLTALHLTDGVLIYASSEDSPHLTTIAAAGKRVHVKTVDVSRSIPDVLAQVGAVASIIRTLATTDPESNVPIAS